MKILAFATVAILGCASAASPVNSRATRCGSAFRGVAGNADGDIVPRSTPPGDHPRMSDGGYASTQCSTASDCTGVLPHICAMCSDGGVACAHYICVAGECRVAICP